MPCLKNVRMKLIVITTPEFFVVEHLIINALFDEGLDALHLRKPGSDAVIAERLLSLVNEEYRDCIITHDHFYLKKKYELGGIHLNSRNPEMPENYRGSVTCSCHSLEEVELYKKKMKYVFLSPIFNSISKTDYHSAFSESALQNAADRGTIDSKVIALGGISEANIPKLRDYGFGGAAVLGALWNKFNAVSTQDFKEVINYFRTLRRISG